MRGDDGRDGRAAIDRLDFIGETRTRNKGGFGADTNDVGGRYRVDDREAVCDWGLAGLGIAVIPALALDEEPTGGRATALLKDFGPKPLPLNAVSPSRRHLPIRLGAMIDFLAHEPELDQAPSAYGTGGRRRGTLERPAPKGDPRAGVASSHHKLSSGSSGARTTLSETASADRAGGERLVASLAWRREA